MINSMLEISVQPLAIKINKITLNIKINLMDTATGLKIASG